MLKRLGLNYIYGLANFTLGVTAGGIWVAVALKHYRPERAQ
jgi:hypothetical protein